MLTMHPNMRQERCPFVILSRGGIVNERKQNRTGNKITHDRMSQAIENDISRTEYPEQMRKARVNDTAL